MSLHNPISPLHSYYVQKVLPAVYDDSLSYYEILCKVQETLNEVVSTTNEQSVVVLEMQQAITDFINGGYTDSFEEYLDKWFDENSEAFVQRLIDEGVIPEVESIQTTLLTLEEYTHGNFQRVNDELDSVSSELQSEIDSVNSNLQSNINKKVPFPLSNNTPSYGINGQVLTTNADGTTEWQNPIVPTDEQAELYINTWLNEHPEATTTVVDGSITTQKLADGSVTDSKLASGGIIDTVKDIQQYTRVAQEYDFPLAGYVMSDGTISTSTIDVAQRTNYISLVGVKTIIYKVNLANTAYAVAFFDSNKDFIQSVSILGTGNMQTAAVVPISNEISSVASYFMVSNYGSNQKSCAISVKDNTFDSRINVLYNELDETLKDTDIESYVGINKFDTENVLIGKEVYADGSIRDNQNSAVSNYIYVHGENSLFLSNLPTYVNSQGNINRYLFFYDIDKEPIGTFTLINRANSQATLVIPQEAYYVNFSVYQRAEASELPIDFSQVMVTFSLVEGYVPFEKYLGSLKGFKVPDEYSFEIWSRDLKLVIFGDSITETATMNDDGSNYVNGTRHNWPEYANEYMAWSSFMNYAKSGAAFRDRENVQFRQSLSNQVSLAISNPINDDADIVVVSAGTNDGIGNLGTYETAMSKQTLQDLDRTVLYEAIRYVFWSLRDKYKNAVCFAALPIQRADKEQPPALLNAITEMAKRYDFIIIDATAKSGIVRENNVWESNGTDLYDGLHPNENGQKKMAALYSSVMSEYFIWKINTLI